MKSVFLVASSSDNTSTHVPGEHLRTFPGIWVPPGTCVLVLSELEATKNTDFILLI